MDIRSPGEGIMADRAGKVLAVESTNVSVESPNLKSGVPETMVITLKPETTMDPQAMEEGVFVWPTFRSWQEPAVKPGQEVKKKELLARGVTHVYFQANV